MRLARRRATLIGLVGLLVALLYLADVPVPTCLQLLWRSRKEEIVLLPAGCRESAGLATDKMTQALEDERVRSGLQFQSWIICDMDGVAPRPVLDLERDRRWLPSYVPGSYQFRRTVVLVPYSQHAPNGSPVVAEVCLLPWQKYLSQIRGECTGRFAAWK